MADTAFQKQYRQEFIAGFEVNQTLLRDAVTTEVQVKGNEAVFLVADSGGAEAVTRGVDGNIPSRADNLNQYTAKLVEYHDKVKKTGFNIFSSQGNQRAIMHKTSMGVINRRIEKSILTELANATNNIASATATVAYAVKALTILQNNDVPNDGNIWAIISPAFLAYLMQTKEFASHDYVRKTPIENTPFWGDRPGFYDWLGVKWIVTPSVTGTGTNAEQCYMFHKSAIGHAAPAELIMTASDYNGEDDYSWTRTSVYEGAKILQNSGILKMIHDGSAYVTS